MPFGENSLSGLTKINMGIINRENRKSSKFKALHFVFMKIIEFLCLKPDTM